MSFTPWAPAAGSVSPAIWLPSDQGLLAATYDPALVAPTGVLIVAGSLSVLKLQARQALTISTLTFGCTAAGAGASSGSFAGLYSSAGVLLSGSADIGSPANGAFSVPLTTPQAVAAGSFVWAAIVFNLATTQPTLARAGAQLALANFGLTAAAARFGVAATLQTTLPGSITPANIVNGSTFWAGAS